MKPTKRQVEVINCVQSIISTWKNSNDIDSATHYCDSSEFIYADLYEYPDEYNEVLDQLMDDLLDHIKLANKIDFDNEVEKS